jgi:hypothetical protein
MSRETVGSEATGPDTAGSARSMPTSARQSHQRDREHHVQHNLARVMDRPSLPSRWESRGYA